MERNGSWFLGLKKSLTATNLYFARTSPRGKMLSISSRNHATDKNLLYNILTTPRGHSSRREKLSRNLQKIRTKCRPRTFCIEETNRRKCSVINFSENLLLRRCIQVVVFWRFERISLCSKPAGGIVMLMATGRRVSLQCYMSSCRDVAVVLAEHCTSVSSTAPERSSLSSGERERELLSKK